uniref:Tyrosine specific protein phosphatases domain-containing protein n=1 Tax=Chlamydomonas leiostraca TaxID=1034604 RepID=A0A7S0RIB1_9CHLO|mmetsp:Transcript_23318/g.59643  ORF Transcript_23318/g.59643 Transcript_23318/m.59643 type:complete len:352 (+) Transcript_23318:206-1261(+)
MMRGDVPLPALPKLPAKEMAGPTPWSNWALPGRVIAGAYPASLDDAETERILTTLLELGINTFVCLQAEVNINTPEHAWRAQHGLRPYIKDAQKILSKAHETGNPKITQQKIDFLHLPIIDGNVTTDSAMNRLVEDCMERVLKGEKLYIHCWGGHGRTGTLVAVMLGRLYNLPYTTALRYTQAFHDSRVYPQGVRSPQTPVQRAQVRRLLAAQSAVASSAPNIINSVARAAPAPAPVVSRPAGIASSGYGLSKPAGSILAPAASRPGMISASDVRSSQAPPSPLRARAGAGSAAVGNRYGVRGVGESPMKGAGDMVKSSADRLASDFSRLQPPSGAGMGRAGVAPYMLAQR